MTYTINRFSDNTIDPNVGFPIIIPDKTVNTTTTSLYLIGRGVTQFGQIVAENFVYLMENFAGTKPPLLSISGQVWYDTNTGRLRVYTGQTTQWVDAGGPVQVQNFPDISISRLREMIYLNNPNGVSGLYLFDGAQWNAVITASYNQNNQPPSSPEADPINGQIHFNASTGKFLIYGTDNSQSPLVKPWRILGPTHFVQPQFPDNTNPTYAALPEKPQTGDLWSDITNPTDLILKMYDGANWNPVVPVVSTATSVTNTVNQVAHGFAPGMAIYFDLITNKYLRAISNSSTSLGMFVVSTVIDNDNFILCSSGYVTGLNSLTVGYLYVSDITAGQLQATTGSFFDNCIFLADTPTSGYVLPWRAVALI